MKYMLLVYAAEGVWTPEEKEKSMAASVELCHQLHANGQYLGASPLHSVNTATCVRNQGDKTLVVDGPFAETHEQLGGYFLVDAPGLDAAIEIAKRIPGGSRGAVEIRPMAEPDGLPAIR